MAKKPIPEFSAPDDNPRLEQSLGKFIVAWGIIERELDNMIAALFNLDPTLSLCITSNLGTKSKLDIIRSAASMLEPALGETLNNEIHDLANATSDHSGKNRNVRAHGQPAAYAIEEGPREWRWTRTSAREKLKATIYPRDPDHWLNESKEVIGIARKLREAEREAEKVISALTADDLDRMCLIETLVLE